MLDESGSREGENVLPMKHQGYRRGVHGLLLAVLTLLLTSSVRGQKVSTGYDKSADFSQYKTYA